MLTLINRMTGRGVLVVSVDDSGLAATLAGATLNPYVERMPRPVVHGGVTYTHAIGKVALTAAEHATLEAALAPIRAREDAEGEMVDLGAAWERARERMDFVEAKRLERAMDAKRGVAQ